MNTEPIYLVDGLRTPFLKARGMPGPFSAADLAVQAGRSLLARQPFLPSDLNEVILGCATPAPDEANIGRVAALRLGCGHRTPAWTVMRNCASGLQAIDSALANIQAGRATLVLAGGVDALSRAPLLYNAAMLRWFGGLMQARSVGARLRQMARLNPLALFKPVIALQQGLTDPTVNLIMGQTAENLAARFAIPRAAMDAFSLSSHQRAHKAAEERVLAGEIAPLFAANGKLYAADDGIRSDASLDGIAKPKAFFDARYGRITAANSSQVSDGAAWTLIAAESAVKRWNLQPLARIVDSHWAGLEPAQMGLGPVYAATPLLQRNGLKLADIDLWEINEAFAAQVLACLAAWQDADFCRNELGLPQPLGALDEARLNIDGGAIALGHPVGASGARIALHLARRLRLRGEKRGIATICIGGGQGGALLLEAV